MSVCKIRVRFGQNEVECEGSEAFLKEELPELIRLMAELAPQVPEQATPPAQKRDDGQSPPPSGSAIVGTTGTIAQRIKAKTGRDLLLAAAAHLTLERRSVRMGQKSRIIPIGCGTRSTMARVSDRIAA